MIQSIKDALERGEIIEHKYVNTKEMLADVLTVASKKSYIFSKKTINMKFTCIRFLTIVIMIFPSPYG